MTLAQQEVHNLLEKFPDAKTLTLAKILYRDHPRLFPRLEAARCCVRYARGNHGTKARKRMASQIHVRPNGKPGDPYADAFDSIPEGSEHFEDWRAIQVDGPFKALVLSDLHIPYHSKEPIVMALRHGLQSGCNLVLMNGDIADCFSVSFWEKDPRLRDFQAELKIVIEFYNTVRKMFPKARIIAKQGNHEERYERYMRVKAPELLGIPKFSSKSIFELDNNGIEWVAEKRPIRLGVLNVIHGHEHNFAFSNPVNPARGFFLRSKVHCLGGHFHQTSQHSEKNLEEKVVSTFSTGCLCSLHPDYRPINSWNHGFATVDVGKDGTFNVENFKIIKGHLYR